MFSSGSADWGRHDDRDDAVSLLLDAAGRTFANLGVNKAAMTDVAAEAGCSRATLYRYFPNRNALQHAFVHRATLRIANSLSSDNADDQDTLEAMSNRILAGIEAVRADPLLAVWFEPENMSVPLAVSQDSEILRSMAAGFVQKLNQDLPPSDAMRTAAWLLRAIVSLLATPGADAEDERRLVEDLLVPSLLLNLNPRTNTP